MTRTSWMGFVLFATVAVVASACGGSTTSPTSPSAATVTSIGVTKTSASGSSVQLAATGHLSDGTTRDVTSAATWESLNPAVASVSQTGLVTTVAKGDVDVRATYQGFTGAMHLSLAFTAPVSSVTISGTDSNGSFQLTAIAHRTDGATENVTGVAVWQSSNPAIASFTSPGFVLVHADGEVDLSALVEGVTGSVHAAVSVEKTYSISGTVFDSASPAKLIAGARVQLVEGDHVFTDADGKYKISGVPSGRTFIEFSAAGYQVKEVDMTVTGSDVTLSVGLDATP